MSPLLRALKGRRRGERSWQEEDRRSSETQVPLKLGRVEHQSPCHFCGTGTPQGSPPPSVMKGKYQLIKPEASSVWSSLEILATTSAFLSLSFLIMNEHNFCKHSSGPDTECVHGTSVNVCTCRKLQVVCVCMVAPSLLVAPAIPFPFFFWGVGGGGQFPSHNHMILAELLYNFLPIPPKTGVEEGAFSARAL